MVFGVLIEDASGLHIFPLTVGIAFSAFSIIGTILGALIGLYVLFEARKWLDLSGKVAAKVKEVTK